jgi:hypothetical protein
MSSEAVIEILVDVGYLALNLSGLGLAATSASTLHSSCCVHSSLFLFSTCDFTFTIVTWCGSGSEPLAPPVMWVDR